MRFTIVSLSLFLAACHGEAIDAPCEPAQSDGGSYTQPHDGGSGGVGGEAPIAECTPGEVCREAHHACDVEEVCDGNGECPRDSQAALGAMPTDDCGLYLCDGHHFECATSCAYDEDCVDGATCVEGECQL